ncbi:MAG: tRNA (adenosine(37)-N6)-threonylcarbamoyltransferase complex dimerization subunit type 1 TsaB [Deltaproteobacteria bacterium]|nr:tRNA (adenosine(37)-N6)-threonylcarbamoyltransferase complex dimerization subunit type 1 TsaB [Deltaproteobacteria bacterium]
MRILAIDTATPSASVALVDEGRILAECLLSGQKNHSERLLQIIDRLFDWTGSARDSIDSIAVSVGPGSFTGLRVGISTAQGLAFALDKPLAGVPALEVVASQATGGDGLVSPMIDARKQQVYACLYHRTGGVLEQVQPATVCDPDAWVQGLPEPALLIGAAVYYGRISACAAAKGCTLAPEHLGIPRASTLAILAQAQYAGRAGRPELVSALYVRPPDAFICEAQK